MKEYVGQIVPQEDHSKFIGKELGNKQENEDMMATNQMENLKEMANAPFGPNQEMTREEYVKKLTLLEEQE